MSHPQFTARLRKQRVRYPNEIQRYRLERNLTQTAVVQLLGIPRSTLSRWEGGRTRPSLARAIELANILQTSVQALYPELFISAAERGVINHRS